MTIDCAFHAVLGKDPERKTSQAGRPYLRLNVRVGAGDQAQWVSVMLAERLGKDSKVYVEGAITADAWIKDGQARASLTCMTWHCTETHRIGRNKPKPKPKPTEPAAAAPARSDGGFHSDEIPFAPEWR